MVIAVGNCQDILGTSPTFATFLRPANEVYKGYGFTHVCLSRKGGVPGQVPPSGQVHPPWAGTSPRAGTPPG